MKKFNVIAVIVFCAAGTGMYANALPAHADSNDCVINVADVKVIKNIQNDPTLSSNQEIQQELIARKQLVARTVNCAKAEAQALQTLLISASVPDDVQQTQTQLSDHLRDAVNFYDIELGKLNDAGIAGTQAIAKDVLTWRQGTYAPLEGTVNNFLLWSQNQVLFRTAQSRMNQTQRAVAFIESAAGNDDLQKAFAGATVSFNAAQSQNSSAKSSIMQFSSSDQSGALIKQSLQSLSDTYQKLFDVSTLITSLLPQSQ